MNAVTDAIGKAGLDTSIKVNGQRLWDSLMTMAKIGATPKGGVCRLALTDLDKEGRDLIVSWAKEAGCTVNVDQMGNVFMRRAGPTTRRVAGHDRLSCRFAADGRPLRRHLRRARRTRSDPHAQRSRRSRREHPVEVVIWTNEEGSRFAPAMVASGVFAGVFTLDYGLSRADVDGKTIGEELKRIGYAGDRADAAAVICMPRSNCISSRVRFSKPRTRRSVSSRTRRASAGTRSR